MKLVKQAKFGNVVCDFWQDNVGDTWMTRDQIGKALEYSDPIRAISKLHTRYEERLNKFSVVTKLTTTDSKAYDTTLYSAKGIMEICRWSRQPKADDFMDWTWDIVDELRTNGVVVAEDATFEQVQFNVDLFLANLDNYNITKLYDLVESFLAFHREKKTKLKYKRTHKARHGNKKYKNHIESMEEIRDMLVDYLNAKIDAFNGSNQAGLAQEYIRIREMVRVSVENMRYRTAACK